MNATRLLLVSFVFLASAACAEDQRPTSPPFTYILDYGGQHINSPEYIESIAKAPPTLLHLGKDVPFTHNWGPIQALGGENQAYGKKRPYAKEDYTRRLSPEEVRQRIADLTKLTSDLHKAGVKWVTPYICSMTIGGKPDTRAGFWEFYGHWDEYKEFGLGERPKTDPIQWMQLTQDGKPQFFYKFDGPFYPPYEPNIRYAACLNNPDWRTWTEKVVENIAKCGLDGVFVDNAGSEHCYCPICKEKWRSWIGKRYTEAERKELFETAQPDMGTNKEPGLLWAETRRFWNSCIAEHLAAIAKAGERISGKPFLVFPNGGEQRPENIMQAFPDTDLIMFERSVGPYGTHPGMVLWKIVEEIGVKKYNDNVFEYKFVQSLRRKVRPILLTRPGWEVPKKVQMALEMNPPSTILGCAETAAFGGGGGFLVRVNPECMQAQKRCRDFSEKNASLYDGLDSFAEVGVAVFPEQTYFGNKAHITEVRKVTQHLLDAHVLFDYVIEDQFTPENLKRFAAVVVPGVQYISDARAETLKKYLEGGGAVVVIGATGDFDEKGRKRSVPALGSLCEKKTGENKIAVAAYQDVLPPHGACLAEWLEKASGKKLSVVETAQTPAFSKVRVNAFRQPGAERTVVHFVNYNVPLGVEAKEPEAVGPVEVALRLPAPAGKMKLTCYDPEADAVELPCKSDGNILRFTLPGLRIYKVVEIRPGAQNEGVR